MLAETSVLQVEWLRYEKMRIDFFAECAFSVLSKIFYSPLYQ